MYTRREDSPILRVDAPRASRRDFFSYFSKWENGKVLLGTAWSWFALDTAFYGLGLNSSIILGGIGFGAPSKTASAEMGQAQAVWLTLRNISVGNLVISITGLIPGFYVTMAFIDLVRTLRSC
jgi:PHS family inorganic phosphate transporter-like MFS transporter